MLKTSKDITTIAKKEIGERINADTPSWQTFADILRGAKIYE